jgi:hypothetical protein
MGTRSTVKFFSEWNDQPLLSVYQQYDGYIDGVGHELANFLLDKKVINGIGSGQNMEGGYANGMGCLAAQYVAGHKTEIGGFYMTTADDEQEYNYEVRLVKDQLIIKVDKFEGTPQELLEYEEPEEEY